MPSLVHLEISLVLGSFEGKVHGEVGGPKRVQSVSAQKVLLRSETGELLGGTKPPNEESHIFFEDVKQNKNGLVARPANPI